MKVGAAICSGKKEQHGVEQRFDINCLIKRKSPILLEPGIFLLFLGYKVGTRKLRLPDSYRDSRSNLPMWGRFFFLSVIAPGQMLQPQIIPSLSLASCINMNTWNIRIFRVVYVSHLSLISCHNE